MAPIPELDGFRRWTAEEFDRLTDDIFAEGEQVELIEGLIYTENETEPAAHRLPTPHDSRPAHRLW